MTHNHCASDSKTGCPRQEMYLVAFSQVAYEGVWGQKWQLAAESAPAEEY